MHDSYKAYLYLGTPFRGSEGDASGGGTSAHAVLRQEVLAVSTQVLVSFSPSPPFHGRDAIFFVRSGVSKMGDGSKRRKPA